MSRRSEIIRHQAGLVSPIEVEAVLYHHPSIKEAGVIGLSDGAGGEVVQAHVVLKEGSTTVRAQELMDFAGARLAAYKVPARIILVDRLPYGPTGKIDRMALRNQAGA